MVFKIGSLQSFRHCFGVNVFKRLETAIQQSNWMNESSKRFLITVPYGKILRWPERRRITLCRTLLCTHIGVQYLQGKHCFYFILRGPIFHVRTTNHQTVLQLIPARSPQTHFIGTETRCGGRRLPLVVMMIHDDIWLKEVKKGNEIWWYMINDRKGNMLMKWYSWKERRPTW